MTANVLMAPAKEQAPVSTKPKTEGFDGWTDYSSVEASTTRRDAQQKKKQLKRQQQKTTASPSPTAAAANIKSIRARIGTKLAIEGDQLVLTGTTNDPGLSFDQLPELKASGPYKLVFSVQSKAGGNGEIFWTTDAKTILPKGQHQTFAVQHDGEWHDITLAIETPDKLHAFRLDPCAAPGEVRLKGLQLRNATDETLQSWPAAAK